MKNTIPSIHRPPAPGWHLLGKFELSSDPNEPAIRTWLVELLIPLNLQTDFVNQLVNSAQDAVARAVYSDAGSSIGHIHLSIFVSNGRASQGKIWGFFRIEKIDNTESREEHTDHALGFYLYLEGH